MTDDKSMACRERFESIAIGFHRSVIRDESGAYPDEYDDGSVEFAWVAFCDGYKMAAELGAKK